MNTHLTLGEQGIDKLERKVDEIGRAQAILDQKVDKLSEKIEADQIVNIYNIII